MKVDFSKVKYDNPCLSCSHTDIMYVTTVSTIWVGTVKRSNL